MNDAPHRPADDRPRRRRRLPTISLRVLMLLVLMLGALMACKANRARAQTRAVAALHAAGANVRYDWQKDGLESQAARPWGPAPLRRWLGDEYFQEVTAVRLYNRRTPPLPLSGDLGHLESLGAGECDLTEADFRRFSELPALRRLVLHRCRGISAASFAHLARVTELQTLSLGDCGPGVADAGLAHLKGLKKLRYVELTRTGVTDAGLPPSRR
jgi:hypothetical protein